MQYKRMNGNLFRLLAINGCENLKLNYQVVDQLNVFPVPDGDTGTNMKITIESGINEIINIHDKNIYELSRKLARGMLMGARGNSGVILSQLFRGLSKGFEGYVSVDADGSTIYGSYFAHQGETPGLGAEIENPVFQEQFIGKHLFIDGVMKPVAVMKKGQKPTNGAEFVDAVSGGTITSKGVHDMIENSLLPYAAFLTSIQK